MEALKQRERRLQEAVIQEDLDEVRRAAEEYRRAFDREWRAMPLDERRRSPLPLEAAELMRWARALMIVSRAALAERHRATGAAGRYLAAGRRRETHTWGSAG